MNDIVDRGDERRERGARLVRLSEGLPRREARGARAVRSRGGEQRGRERSRATAAETAAESSAAEKGTGPQRRTSRAG